MTYQVSISGPISCAVFDLKGHQTVLADALSTAALPEWPKCHNHMSQNGAYKLLWIGFDHWLVVAEDRYESEIADHIKGAEFSDQSTILNVSDLYVFFSIAGRDADHILSICSPLDHHPAKFTHDAACFTEFFGLKGLVFQNEDGYMIGVDRSYSGFIHTALTQIAFGN
jgi:heterotetrameric sarcosine oxidase gamma subunit